MPNVIVADSVTESREALKSLLKVDPTIQVVADARDGQEALELARTFKPDVVIVDANISGLDALELTDRLTPTCEVIVVGYSAEEGVRRRFRTAGAFEYLLKPLARDELIEEIFAAAQRVHKQRMILASAGADVQKKGKIVCLYSPKGGAGSTILSANLGVALAQLNPGRVALVDLNLHFGDIDMVLNINAEQTIATLAQRQNEFDAEVLERYLTLHEESGLKVLAAPSAPQYAEVVTVYLVEQVLEMLKSNYDYIIVDTPAITTDTTMAALDQCDLILLVTTLDLLALHNTKTAWETLKKLYGQEKIKILLNRSNSQMGLTPEDVEHALGCPIFARVPSDGKIAVTSINDGEPFVLSHAHAEISRAVLNLAYLVMEKEPPSEAHLTPTTNKRRRWWLMDWILGPSPP